MAERAAFIHKALNRRALAGQLRSMAAADGRRDGWIETKEGPLLNLCGNDYLGLSQHPAVIRAGQQAYAQFGAGSTGSRLITGTTTMHEQLETEMASWIAREAVLLFNSGYQMNATLIPALTDKNALLFFDKLNHNSLLHRARVSDAQLHRYRHADYSHLRSLLQKHACKDATIIIVSETVFSMDGDIADLSELTALADQYNAILIIDEAHSLGLFGQGGRGLSYLNDRVDIVLGTFGKSFGTAGAFAACSAAMREYLINFCSGFIYSTALPPPVVASTLASVQLMETLQDERSVLFETAAWFRNALIEVGFNVSGSRSQIVPALIGSEDQTMHMAKQLKSEGYLVIPIRPPTVPAGSSRLRFTINSNLRTESLKGVVECLKNR